MSQNAHQGNVMNEGYSKVSLQSPVALDSPVQERMLGDQPNKDIVIPDGVFNPNYNNKPQAHEHEGVYDEEYPKLKSKPDEFDWKLLQVSARVISSIAIINSLRHFKPIKKIVKFNLDLT